MFKPVTTEVIEATIGQQGYNDCLPNGNDLKSMNQSSSSPKAKESGLEAGLGSEAFPTGFLVALVADSGNLALLGWPECVD